MNIVYNMDCMEGMKRYPDGYFDLAVVDPVYGDVPYGGYMSNTGGGLGFYDYGVTEDLGWFNMNLLPERYATLLEDNL